MVSETPESRSAAMLAWRARPDEEQISFAEFCAGWQARAAYELERTAELRTALEWYADPDHWACPWDYTHADGCAYYCQATEDRGEMARDALAHPEPSAAEG